MLARRLLPAIIVVLGCCRWLTATEPVAREIGVGDLASPQMAALIEINRPMLLFDNPLSHDICELLRQSIGVQRALTSPDVDRFRQAGKFIEKSLAVDWRTGLARLTAGGIVAVIQPSKSPTEPAVTVVITAADAHTLKQFIDAIQVEIRRRAGADRSPEGTNPEDDVKAKSASGNVGKAETIDYRAFAIHRVGNGYFSLVGRQLVASNSRAQLESALDRLLDKPTEEKIALPASLRLVDAKGNAPVILATANLKLIREESKDRSGLQLPANEPLPPLLLGGYLDLVRRADFAAAGLFVNGNMHELHVRLPAGSRGAYAGLSGFFASVQTESAPPLLHPTGTIFSAGWYRDYKRLWDSRRELVNSEIVKQLEAANERALNDGLRVGIADLVQWIGPQIRVVVARPREDVYQGKLEERLPALALVIGLRDEDQVRNRILAPAEGLLLVALGKSIEDYKKVDYRDVTLTTIRFADNLDEADPGKAVLYNFNPAYAISHAVSPGQLILGSTAEIVRDVVDDLERQAPGGPSGQSGLDQSNRERAGGSSARPTDRQRISLVELSEFLKGFQNRLERDAAQAHGLSPADARNEVELLYKLIARLGSLTTSTAISADHFDIHVRLGME
jgi:hypothetical protein